MTIRTLTKILLQNDISPDAQLLSDSGWEGRTDINGIFYCEEENWLVFTQDYDDSYYKNSEDYIELKEKI